LNSQPKLIAEFSTVGIEAGMKPLRYIAVEKSVGSKGVGNVIAARNTVIVEALFIGMIGVVIDLITEIQDTVRSRAASDYSLGGGRQMAETQIPDTDRLALAQILLVTNLANVAATATAAVLIDRRMEASFALAACLALTACDKPNTSPEATQVAISELPLDPMCTELGICMSCFPKNWISSLCSVPWLV